MWVAFAIVSMLSLGFYDVFKKLALERNNVFWVLFLNTVFCTLFMLPVLVKGFIDGSYSFNNWHNHGLMLVKAAIVTSSWLLGYFAIKNLPLTLQGSINALRPVLVLVGAIIIFDEGSRINALQWIGIALGVVSLAWIGFIGRREGVTLKNSLWLLSGLLSVVLWAASGLYDKWLMSHGFHPLEVEAWYSFYQFVIMLVVVAVVGRRFNSIGHDRFQWRWSILLISVFIAVADLTYFYALSAPEALVSVASMIRRGSALVAFFYGIFVLHERNVRLKIIDQSLLIIGVTLMILGSVL